VVLVVVVTDRRKDHRVGKVFLKHTCQLCQALEENIVIARGSLTKIRETVSYMVTIVQEYIRLPPDIHKTPKHIADKFLRRIATVSTKRSIFCRS